MHAVVEELRRRAADLTGLLAADAAPDELVATACPDGCPVPADLLVGVACGMRDRELTAEHDARRRKEAVKAARSAGEAWAVLVGPSTVDALLRADEASGTWPAGGRRQTLHLASGTLLEVVVDPWEREAPFAVTRTPGETRTFQDRDAWLAEITRIEAEVEDGATPG